MSTFAVPEKETVSPEAPTTVAQPDALNKQNEADARQLQEFSVLDEDLCAICMENEKTHIVIPCGHECICGPSMVPRCLGLMNNILFYDHFFFLDLPCFFLIFGFFVSSISSSRRSCAIASALSVASALALAFASVALAFSFSALA